MFWSYFSPVADISYCSDDFILYLTSDYIACPYVKVSGNYDKTHNMEHTDHVIISWQKFSFFR